MACSNWLGTGTCCSAITDWAMRTCTAGLGCTDFRFFACCIMPLDCGNDCSVSCVCMHLVQWAFPFNQPVDTMRYLNYLRVSCCRG